MSLSPCPRLQNLGPFATLSRRFVSQLRPVCRHRSHPTDVLCTEGLGTVWSRVLWERTPVEDEVDMTCGDITHIVGAAASSSRREEGGSQLFTLRREFSGVMTLGGGHMGPLCGSPGLTVATVTGRFSSSIKGAAEKGASRPIPWWSLYLSHVFSGSTLV